MILSAVAGLSGALSRPAAAQGDQKRVLVLQATRRDSPAAVTVDATFHRVLAGALGTRLDYHSEFIDLMRFNEPAYRDAFREYLRVRYGHLPIDLVMVSTTDALDFVIENRRIFRNSALLFSAAGRSAGPNSTGFASGFDFSGTLDVAMALQPDATDVHVVCGASDFDRFYEGVFRQQSERYADRLTFTYLCGLSVPEIERRVRALPANAFVYFISVSVDGAGQNFVPMDVLERVAKVASAPTYSWVDTAIGRGIVGGRVRLAEERTRQLADVALRILGGERAETIPISTATADRDVFDWRQLRRWRIAEDRLPAGSQVLFREPTVWDQYRPFIVSALVLVALQSALIAGLLVQRSRRRRAEASLRAKKTALSESYEEVRALLSRVLTTQEAERTRIARDLHDDVAQGMSALFIGIGALRMQAGADEPSLQSAIASIQQQASAVAENLRAVSHDLHPQSLQTLGLAGALVAHCDEVMHRTGLQVSTFVGDGIGMPSPETALCLYRVAQEALRNTRRHAGATRADVSLTRAETMLELVIADDGTGFDLAHARRAGSGLGLVSIEERVRLVGGSVTIDTAPGRGTTVRVHVPTDGAGVRRDPSGFPSAQSTQVA